MPLRDRGDTVGVGPFDFVTDSLRESVTPLRVTSFIYLFLHLFVCSRIFSFTVRATSSGSLRAPAPNKEGGKRANFLNLYLAQMQGVEVQAIVQGLDTLS